VRVIGMGIGEGGQGKGRAKGGEDLSVGGGKLHDFGPKLGQWVWRKRRCGGGGGVWGGPFEG